MSEQRPGCPRCGYDLSGIVSAWTRSCPLDGRCSECGLQFPWRFVLDSRLRGPGWSIEHWQEGDGRLGFVRRLLGTSARAYEPRRLWQSLGMHHRIRWVMLLRGCAFGVLVSYVVASAVAIGLRTLLMYLYVDAMGWTGTGLWQSTAALVCWPLAEGQHYFWWPMLLDTAWLATWFWLMPVCFVIFRRTLRAARVRPAHIVRITLYGLMGWPLVLAIYSVLCVDAREMAGELLDQASRALVNSSGPVAGFDEWLGAGMAVLGAMLIGLWQGVFWWRAIKWYLKLRHAFLTAVAITIVSLLGSIVVTGLGEPAWALVAAFFGIDLA